MTIDGFRLIENPPPYNHTCPVPMQAQWVTVPAAPPPPQGWQGNPPSRPTRSRIPDVPDGQLGDVWQCATCSQHWQLVHEPNIYQYGYSPSYDEWRKINRRKAQRLVRRATRKQGR